VQRYDWGRETGRGFQHGCTGMAQGHDLLEKNGKDVFRAFRLQESKACLSAGGVISPPALRLKMHFGRGHRFSQVQDLTRAKLHLSTVLLEFVTPVMALFGLVKLTGVLL